MSKIKNKVEKPKKKKAVAVEEPPKKKKKKPADADLPKKKKKRPKAEAAERVAHDVPKKKKKKKKKAPLIDGERPKVPKLSEPEPIMETPAEKYQRELREEKEKQDREDRAYKQLTMMKRRDVQKECILRGCPFEQAAGFSTPQLHGWFTTHLDDGQDLMRLTEYDSWREAELIKRGNMAEDGVLLHPSLKFGLTGSSTEWDSKALKNSTQPLRDSKATDDKPKKEKVLREKDEKKGGIYTGTKKHMTYELALEGKPMDEIIQLVTAQFPEANDKSIKIWVKRALKGE